ncbi:MAG TPA: histidine kinase [Candidatus Limnocylindrales bacterium]|nr:histidine kinase [Candidatus Limnocylindrales bacterium]
MLSDGRRRLVLAAIGIVALVFGPFAAYQLTRTAERSPALLLADVAVGWSMIAAGLIIADRRPGNRIGPLAILTGFAWFLGDFTNSDVAVVSYLATVFHGWFDPLFALVILAYPTGRITRRLDRALAIGFVAVQAAWTLVQAYGLRPIAWWDCPTCISTVDRWTAAYTAMDPLGRIETLLLTGLSVGLLVVVTARWVSASGAARSRQTPVLLAGLVLGGSFIVTFLWQTVLPTNAREPLGELRVIVLALSRVLVAIALMIGVLRDDAAKGRIADLVVRLDGLPPLPVLQASLRDALGDPSLEVYRWKSESGAFTDAAGQLATPPADGAARAVLAIGTADAPELLIAHDPALRDDPGLVSAAAAAVRLAVENERLQAEVRAQLDAVTASRARIVEAQDDERRRIERDLHDGAQQRLVSLQLSLQMLRRDLGPEADPAAVAELEAASAEAAAAIADIRELARGVHPAILTESGLGAALGSLADRAPLPVVLTDDLDRRLPGSVEATAYFVAAEALTNAIKHSGASRIDLRTWLADDHLHLDVSDDGRGGADATDGTGLTGIHDRVAALGGTVRVESRVGEGTRLMVALPCASP